MLCCERRNRARRTDGAREFKACFASLFSSPPSCARLVVAKRLQFCIKRGRTHDTILATFVGIFIPSVRDFTRNFSHADAMPFCTCPPLRNSRGSDSLQKKKGGRRDSDCSTEGQTSGNVRQCVPSITETRDGRVPLAPLRPCEASAARFRRARALSPDFWSPSFSFSHEQVSSEPSNGDRVWFRPLPNRQKCCEFLTIPDTASCVSARRVGNHDENKHPVERSRESARPCESLSFSSERAQTKFKV